jgi:hypothetical protein
MAELADAEVSKTSGRKPMRVRFPLPAPPTSPAFDEGPTGVRWANASRRGSIRGVSRRALLLAVLIYVTLDLSLPAMPGAFVFEPGDSVEGTHGRGRQAAEVVALPTLTGHAPVLLQPRIDFRHRRPPVSDVVRLARSATRCLPRAVCDPSPLSEDPH